VKLKWRNRSLERGVVIDRGRGYVYVRFTRQGVVRKELIGRTTDIDVIDKANFRAQHIRNGRRAQVPDFDPRKQRLLMEDAVDLFLKLHGEKRQSAKGIKQFRRHARLVKQAWAGRYVDAMIGDDMRLARALAEAVRRTPELELLTQALSITTFRYVPAELAATIGDPEVDARLDAINRELLDRLQRGGELFVSNAVVGGRYALRACVVNFQTTPADIDAIPAIVVRVGREVVGA
jgi:hypothetical protein